MKNLFKYFIGIIAILILLTSCSEKKSESPSEILAGTDSKTWHISKQLDAQGDKEKVTSEEEDETLNLYSNGKFSIVDASGTATGTWSVIGSEKLSLHFDGENITENFSITELKNDKVALTAGDGSAMVLKSK